MYNHDNKNYTTAPVWFRKTKLFLDIASLLLAFAFFGISIYTNIGVDNNSVFLAFCVVQMAVLLPAGVLCDYFSAKLDCSVGAHRCRHCGHVHMPEKTNYLAYIGFGCYRYLRCPACGKKSSHKKVFEEQ